MLFNNEINGPGRGSFLVCLGNYIHCLKTMNGQARPDDRFQLAASKLLHASDRAGNPSFRKEHLEVGR